MRNKNNRILSLTTGFAVPVKTAGLIGGKEMLESKSVTALAWTLIVFACLYFWHAVLEMFGFFVWRH